jgi:predicted AAA+ superfamily ATPase
MKTIITKLSKQFLSKKALNTKRFLYDEIDFKSRIIGIKGARGVGKTTIMHQYAKSSKLKISQKLYISCDHPAIIGEDLFEIASEFYRYGGKLLLIDEIHKSKDFAKHIKAIYDFTDLQVVFSGSSAMQIAHEISDLSRRASIYNLPVLSFREYLMLSNIANFDSYTFKEIIENHEDISFEISSKIKPLEHFKDYIRFGAYPFFKESIRDYGRRMVEVINTTIDVDLSSIFNIDSDKRDTLKKVLYMLCSTTPFEISKSKLSSATGISWPTLSKYLEYMQKGSLITITRSGKAFKSINKPNKMLLNNPNLFYCLCANPDIGVIRGSFFVSQVSTKHQIHYFDNGDFIIDDKYIIEIGGTSKDKKQIKTKSNSYLAIDGIEFSQDNMIPLWLFGFLY